VKDGSFMRVRNVTLGYSLPKNKLGKSLSNLRIYVTAQNLFTFTKYDGYDPELGGDNFIFGRGIDYGNYPQPRTYMLGVQVGF
jgi:outer membrane receptor protein involved in Fe transport